MRSVVRACAILACATLLLSACGGSGGRSKSSRFRKPYKSALSLYSKAKKYAKDGDMESASAKLEDAQSACERLLDRISESSGGYKKKTQELLAKVQKSMNEVAEKIKDEELALKKKRDAIKVAVAKPISTGPAGPKKTLEMQRFERERAERQLAKEEDEADDEDAALRATAKADRRNRKVEEASEEDFDDEEKKRTKAHVAPAEKPEAKLGFDPNNIKPDTMPLVLGKRMFKGKFFIVHVWVVNKGEVCRVGRVEAQLRDSNHKLKVASMAFYRADGFEPNWKDIYESKGEQLAADSVQIQANKAVEVVCVGDYDRPKDVKKVQVEAILNTKSEPLRSQVIDF